MMADSVRKNLLQFVSAVNGRVIANRFITALFALLSIVTLGLAPVALILRVRGNLWSPAAGWPVMALAVVIGVIIVSAVWAITTAPGPARASRLVDRRLGLGELFSTVLEQLVVTEPSLVLRALYEEAEFRLRTINPGAVEPIHLRRWFIALPLAVLVTATAAIVPVGTLETGLQSGQGDRDHVDVATNLVRLADLLESSESSASPDIRNVTEELRLLAEQATRVRMADLALGAEVAATLREVADAFAPTDGAFAEQIYSALDTKAGSRTDGDEATEGPTPFRFDEKVPSQETLSSENGNPTQANSDFDPSDVFRTLGEIVSSAESRAAELAAGATDPQSSTSGAASSSRGTGYYTDWDEEMAQAVEARRAAIRQRGQGQAVAGEAAQSDDAPGDAAGLGSQPLGSGNEETPAALLNLTREQVGLSTEILDDGMTVTYTPEPAMGTSQFGWSGASLQETLLAGVEAPLGTESVDHRDAQLVADYFRPAGTPSGSSR